MYFFSPDKEYGKTSLMSTILHRQTWPGLFIYLLKLLYIKIVVLITFRIHEGSLMMGWHFPLSSRSGSLCACSVLAFPVLFSLPAKPQMLCSLVHWLNAVLYIKCCTNTFFNVLGWEYFLQQLSALFLKCLRAFYPRTAAASSEKFNILLLLFSTKKTTKSSDL